MIPKLTKQGTESLRRVLRREQASPSTQGTGTQEPYRTPRGGGRVRFAKAKQDWTANGTFKAFKLEWSGSAFTQLTEEIDIRDVFGFAGKSGQTLAYVEMNGTFFHLQSGCPTT